MQGPCTALPIPSSSLPLWAHQAPFRAAPPLHHLGSPTLPRHRGRDEHIPGAGMVGARAHRATSAGYQPPEDPSCALAEWTTWRRMGRRADTEATHTPSLPSGAVSQPSLHIRIPWELKVGRGPSPSPDMSTCLSTLVT